MSKAHYKAVDHPSIITVGDLIDQLCRLPDTAVVHFCCPMLDQELTFHRLRKRSKDAVEIAVSANERPPVVPSVDGDPQRYVPVVRAAARGISRSLGHQRV